MDTKHETFLNDLLIEKLRSNNEVIKEWLEKTGINNIPQDVRAAICEQWILKTLPLEYTQDIMEHVQAKAIIDQVTGNKGYITYTKPVPKSSLPLTINIQG